jgi:hypothetical protein
MKLEDCLTVEVKTKLTVEEDTLYTCINLITIFAREHGYKGMVMEFDDKYAGGCNFQMTKDEFAVAKAVDALF